MLKALVFHSNQVIFKVLPFLRGTLLATVWLKLPLIIRIIKSNSFIRVVNKQSFYKSPLNLLFGACILVKLIVISSKSNIDIDCGNVEFSLQEDRDYPM